MVDPVTPTIGIVLADDHPVVRRGLRLLLDADGEQVLDLAALIEDDERCVARARDFAGCGQDAIEDRLRIELTDEGASGIEETTHAQRVGRGAHPWIQRTQRWIFYRRGAPRVAPACGRR
jgi:DNA-binding NarL/FixJ family response regulator